MEFATIVFAVAAIAAAACVGRLLGYYSSRAEAPDLTAECNKLRSDIEALSTELRNATASLSTAREENASLAKRVAGLTRHYVDQTNRMRELEQQRSDAEMHSRELGSEVARLRERESHFAAKAAEQATQLVDIQKKLDGLSMLERNGDEASLPNITLDGLKEAQVN